MASTDWGDSLEDELAASGERQSQKKSKGESSSSSSVRATTTTTTSKDTLPSSAGRVAAASLASLPPPHTPWKRLLALNIMTFVALLLVIAKDISARRHPFFSGKEVKRQARWMMQGTAHDLLEGGGSSSSSSSSSGGGGGVGVGVSYQVPPLPSTPPVRRPDGLGSLWDPVCQLSNEPTPPGSTWLDLCVSSELDQRGRRDAIRQGYGAHAAALNVSLRFFVGQPQPGTHEFYSMEGERRRYNDVVILPMQDTYENLTLKTLAMLSYASACGTSPYVVKADDDVMVFLARLRVLTGKFDADAYMYKTSLGVYAGNLWINTPPIVAKGNKNEESKWTLTEIPRDNATDPPLSRGKFFYPYAGGPFYIMSRPAASFLRRNAHRLNWRWRNEDMAVGTWFAGADVETINTFQIKVLHWRWSTHPYVALHNIDDRERVEEWLKEWGGNTTLP
jgi:hypothetical protein